MILVSLETLSKKPPLQACKGKWWEYVTQQGLSKEEMDQAITSFKNQKKASTPDVEGLQNQLTETNKAVLKTQIENKALLMHSELGVDLNTIPLIMKLADLSGVIVDGAINEDGLKEEFNAVLESVPQFKVQIFVLKLVYIILYEGVDLNFFK